MKKENKDLKRKCKFISIFYSLNFWNFFMKDLIKRISIAIVSWSFLWYVLYLFFQNQIIVQGGFEEYNLVYIIVLLVVGLYLFILFGAYPLYFKMTKANIFVLGIALVILWDSVLTNNIENHVYLWDLVKLFGVILTLLAWTNVLVTDKVKKQKAESKMEIIEV